MTKTYWTHMTPLTLILRSLRFYWRSHLGVFLGSGIATAVLTGALVVGDSVRYSLLAMARERIGNVDYAMESGDRYFRARLADELQAALGASTAPALKLSGTIHRQDGNARANHAQILGVDERFSRLATRSTPPLHERENDGRIFPALLKGETALNEALAKHLDVKPGDHVILRMEKPGIISRDAVLMPDDNATVALRLTVKHIVSGSAFGNFSLQASSLPSFNVFLPLPELQHELGIAGQANLLLVGGNEGVLLEDAQAAIRKFWQLADAGLELRELLGPTVLELRTSNIFLGSSVGDTALKATKGAKGIFGYFVNELSVGEHSTPYSIVAAMDFPWVSTGLKDDEITINEWLAEDLHARPGDTLTIKYFVPGSMRKLEERSAVFHVRNIVPISGAAADRALMPPFPGLADASNCRNWKPGFPINLDKIRVNDEEYWKQHHGTPKAFVTLAAGQALWSNRFGALTAVRYPLAEVSRDSLTATLRQALDPKQIGLYFRAVRAQAFQSADQATDFGQLFLGLSFFLVIAALLLLGLLFVFGIEQRVAELGTLLALGFTGTRVRWMLCLEGSFIASLGGVAGVFGGVWYAEALLYGLSTVWRGAVNMQVLRYHAEPSTLVIGASAGALVSALTIGVSLGNLGKRPVRELLAAGGSWGRGLPSGTRYGWGIWVALISGSAAILLLIFANGEAAGLFFGAAALLLVAGAGILSVIMKALSQTSIESSVTARLNLSRIAVRNCTRRGSRSLATMALIACGSFLVIAVGANRREVENESLLSPVPLKRDQNSGAGISSCQADRNVCPTSGTGGFALYGESTLPVVHDLNGKEGRDFFALEDKDLEGTSIVPFRIREGEDASCLNLNRAQMPRLMGVSPELLAHREAFSFSRKLDNVPQASRPLVATQRTGGRDARGTNVEEGSPSFSPWLRLDDTLAGGEVPAIVDQATLQWGLGKSLGDTVTYTGENGQIFNARIVGTLADSVLQGSLIISERNFILHYPSTSGYRLFLIDVPNESSVGNVERENSPTTGSFPSLHPFSNTGLNKERAKQVAGTLSRALGDVGLELTSAAARLDALHSVENTYLTTFQMLGGLGLLLGSLGLGVLVLRNVLERRSELALLRAVGFSKRSLRKLVMREHMALLICGLVWGMAAALVAIWPSLRSTGKQLPLSSLFILAAGLLLNGGFWTWLATIVALRGPLLESLREEG